MGLAMKVNQKQVRKLILRRFIDIFFDMPANTGYLTAPRDDYYDFVAMIPARYR